MTDVSPELREWIEENNRKGVPARQLKAILEDAGHDPRVVDEVLGRHRIVIKRPHRVRRRRRKKRQPRKRTAQGETGWRTLLTSPTDFYSDKGPDYMEGIRFTVGVLGISGLLTGLLPAVGLTPGQLIVFSGISGATAIVTSLIMVLVAGISALLLYAGVTHSVLSILGKTQSFETTFTVYSYASVVALTAWIPFVGLVVPLYALRIVAGGVETMHGATKRNSMIAAASPLMLSVIVLTVLVAL